MASFLVHPKDLVSPSCVQTSASQSRRSWKETMLLYRAAESHCSMLFCHIPLIDEFRGRDGSIAIIVSPLKTLMKN